MIVKPTVTELLKKAKNRYELVIATSRRARQIAMGDEPLTKVKEESPVTLAANEIAEGKVSIVREENDEGRTLAVPGFVFYDIMSLKEEQVASKQTFVFLGSLANEYPAKQDVKCDSTNS